MEGTVRQLVGDFRRDAHPLNLQNLPEQYRAPLLRYVARGCHPGSFLDAALRNDLRGVFAIGDNGTPEFLADLRAIVRWIYSEAPAMCWGTPGRVTTWLSEHARAATREKLALSDCRSRELPIRHGGGLG